MCLPLFVRNYLSFFRGTTYWAPARISSRMSKVEMLVANMDFLVAFFCNHAPIGRPWVLGVLSTLQKSVSKVVNKIWTCCTKVAVSRLILVRFSIRKKFWNLQVGRNKKNKQKFHYSICPKNSTSVTLPSKKSTEHGPTASLTLILMRISEKLNFVWLTPFHLEWLKIFQRRIITKTVEGLFWQWQTRSNLGHSPVLEA